MIASKCALVQLVLGITYLFAFAVLNPQLPYSSLLPPLGLVPGRFPRGRGFLPSKAGKAMKTVAGKGDGDRRS